jgi:DNA-binding CsgD family transcriptional regulator
MAINGKRSRTSARSRAHAVLQNGNDAQVTVRIPRAPALSLRERDCLAFVAQGMNDADVALRLGIAQSTAHFYIEKAKRKLGAKTRAQAVAHLIAAGLF